MHITILTVGSRGDVQPFIALALGLRARGHEVQIATHSEFRAVAEEHQLGFVPIEGNPREWLDTERGLQWIESGLNLVRFFRGLHEFVAPVVRDFPRCLAACEGTDVLLYSTLAFSGPHIAEKLGIPSFPLMLQPTLPSGEFPSLLAWTKRRRPRWYNRLTFFLLEQGFHLATRSAVNHWRRAWGLSRDSILGNFHRQRQLRTPHFLGYSPSVLPKPADWGPHVHVTGYWFMPPDKQWQPAPELVAFLQQGPPPVYVGFGSVTLRNPAEFTRTIVSALEMAGQRGLLSRGWANLGGSTLPKTVMPINALPHEWLFPQLSAVVHHGGAGTTATGLRFGLPSIALPSFADQFLWGERTVALGASPTCLPFASVTVPALARAILAAVRDQHYRNAAQKISALIQAERGVENMVSAFERAMDRSTVV